MHKIRSLEAIASHILKNKMKTLILIVDSEPDACNASAKFLENKGYKVAKAEGSKKAISLLSRIRPAIILIDAKLPVMNGFETCAQIQRQFTKRKMAVIMVTALENPQSIDAAFAAGADEYITKPIHWGALERRIVKILERQFMEKALRNTNEEMAFRAKRRTRELLQANENLQFSEEKLRALVEATPDTILLLDEKGEIIFINHAPPGKEDSNLMGNRLLDVLPEPSKPRFNLAMYRMFIQKQAESFDVVGPSATSWQIRTVPLVKRENSPLQSAMVIVTDRTEQHNTQAQAMRNARLATVGNLAASVAHEVNNPNNAILLQAFWLVKAIRELQIHMQEEEEQYANVIAKGYPLAEVIRVGLEFLADIVNNSRRIGTIVSNLKRISKPDDGVLRDNIDIKMVLDSSLSILANQVHKYCETCSIETESDLAQIRGNRQQLEQVFINLILNALQALAHRKQKVRVHVWHDQKIQKIAVLVEDEGVGITEDNLEKIEKPFFTTKLS